ncbi:ubiquitin-associated domain-containing protein 1 [Nematostella vectensis]|uniref:ubiquitin-associated domain-containing protein 1 n=1 Tax=Nematostella vectensis TaxID=45351 RepID=UPI00207704CE|nr:ubiquitin-associated domain-containing protein 1 [Nematostella vectensis]
MRDFELQGLKSLRSVPLIRIKVTCTSGKDQSLAVSLKDTVSLVKDRVLGGEFCKESSFYKLVVAKTRRNLSDENTLEKEGISEDDELILLKRRHSSACDHEKEKKRITYKIPDISTIHKLTSTLPADEDTEVPTASSTQFNFNRELRRILVSLIDSSILLQSLDEDSQEASTAKPEEPSLTVDPVSLKQLTDMGFDTARATKSLLANRMSPMLAMEWLLQHESDSDIDEPSTPSTSQGRTHRKRREFTPNPQSVRNLKEMGFEEEEIMVALKVSGNNPEAACDWLLGDRKEGAMSSDEGLDPESPMYKAIMENPLVQLSLYNPRVLGAFEDMLDSPNTSNVYINDPETGPVLLQISCIVQGFAR